MAPNSIRTGRWGTSPAISIATTSCAASSANRDRPRALFDHRQIGLRNVQPLFAELAEGGFAVAQNGNLSNAMKLRRTLNRRGSIFQSTSDTEVDHSSRRDLRLHHWPRSPDRRVEEGRRRLLTACTHPRRPDRLPRPARNSAFGHGQARRSDDFRVRNRGAGRDWRDLPARRRARRAGPGQRIGHSLLPSVRQG